MELKKGQIVQSRKGRDVTKFYVVAGFEGQWVLLVNGKERPLANPKKKNLRHINVTRALLKPEETDTDLTLKTALKAYIMLHGPNTAGRIEELG